MMSKETTIDHVEFHSVALIGSSGGGTATLGHTNPVELLTTIHQELLRIRDDSHGLLGRRKVCVGLSHAIFVSLVDGSGFDSIGKKDWFPVDGGDDGDSGNNPSGPRAALYSVGSFDEHAESPFCVTKLEEGPLSVINRRVKELDEKLSRIIKTHHALSTSDTSDAAGKQQNDHRISAIISLSSEPTILHSSSLKQCSQCNERANNHVLAVAGSGGTSLSQIASIYDLPIIGNSGGSVASTTVTKARGWAMGLASLWNMSYEIDHEMGDAGTRNFLSKVTPSDSSFDTRNESILEASQNAAALPVPTLKSILESALPNFLFVCLALRLMSVLSEKNRFSREDGECQNTEGMIQHHTSDIIEFALRYIVPGTACCVLAAISRSGGSAQSGDQSTLLLAATLAGVMSSASSSQASFQSTMYALEEKLHMDEGGGSALSGLIAGAIVPHLLKFTSNICTRYHVTATMTNILLGGGVGMVIGCFMHFSGLAHGLAILTKFIRCILRFQNVTINESDAVRFQSFSSVPYIIPCWLERIFFGVSALLRNQLSHVVDSTFLSGLFYRLQSPSAQEMYHVTSSPAAYLTDSTSMSLPIGFGFFLGCVFVYGSKIGWYHKIFLPLILLEMDSAAGQVSASLWGAIDECTLVMVCAGVCTGNLLVPTSSKEGATKGGGHASLSWQALKTNILCGDFIEAAYPSMERSSLINAATYLAAGLSSEILAHRRVLSTAYLPLPVVIWLSNDRLGMGSACAVAFAISLLGTCVSNSLQRGVFRNSSQRPTCS